MMNAVNDISPIFGKVTTEQFKEFILPLKNKLFRFALSFLLNEDDAKDVVQDVMIKSWEEIDDIKTIRNMEAWCITMTRNKSLDRLRKKGRNYLQISDQKHLKSSEPNPLQKISTVESYSAIRGVISGLPDKQQEVIVLRDMEGYTYKEISKLLDIDLNHVKVLLHRARAAVKKKLEPIYGEQNYSS